MGSVFSLQNVTGLATGLSLYGIFKALVVGTTTILAEAGVITGSYLGIKTSAQTIFFLSTAAKSGLVGLSAATLLGGALICVAVGGGIWLYIRSKKPNIQPPSPGPKVKEFDQGLNQTTDDQAMIDHIIVDRPLTRRQVQNRSYNQRLPQFKPLKFTKKEFNKLKSMSEQNFHQRVKKFICKTTNMVMRQPSNMNCCKKNKNIKIKRAERLVLQDEIKIRQKCLFCRKQGIDKSYIEEDARLYDEIRGFRQRLLKTYSNLNSKDKQIWRMMIDIKFGTNYTKEHLDDFKTDD